MRARLLDLHHRTKKRLKRLRREAEQEGEYRVAKRLHAILLCSGGYTSGDISSLLEAPRSKVSEWLRRYEDYGYDGLLEGHRSGRPRELSKGQEQELADIIESGPTAYGFLGGVWTGPMIKRVIEMEFEIAYHSGHVCRLLHQLGFSVQRPKRILAKADPEKQNRWRRYTYPNIKKKPIVKEEISTSKMKRALDKTQPFTKHGHE